MREYILHTIETEYLTFRVRAHNEADAVAAVLGKNALTCIEIDSLKHPRIREVHTVIPVTDSGLPVTPSL